MIIIMYSACPIFTNPPEWLKTLSNNVKTHLPPTQPPRCCSGPSRPARVGEKMISWRGGGGNYWDHAQYIPPVYILGFLIRNQWHVNFSQDQFSNQCRRTEPSTGELNLSCTGLYFVNLERQCGLRPIYVGKAQICGKKCVPRKDMDFISPYCLA